MSSVLRRSARVAAAKNSSKAESLSSNKVNKPKSTKKKEPAKKLTRSAFAAKDDDGHHKDTKLEMKSKSKKKGKKDIDVEIEHEAIHDDKDNNDKEMKDVIEDVKDVKNVKNAKDAREDDKDDSKEIKDDTEEEKATSTSTPTSSSSSASASTSATVATATATSASASASTAAPTPGILEIGDTIPDITLPNQDDKPVSLKAMAEVHKLIIIFAYPKASTPGCTRQACGFQSNFNDLKDKALVLGLSADAPSVQLKFKNKQGLQYDLLSDVERELIGVLGAKKNQRGVKRSHWIFKEGILVTKKIQVSPDVSVNEGKEKILELASELKKNSNVTSGSDVASASASGSRSRSRSGSDLNSELPSE